MEKFDSQPRSIMLPTINSFKLMKSNHEYQIMKYFSATMCQNVVPQNKMNNEIKLIKTMIEILMAYLD